MLAQQVSKFFPLLVALSLLSSVTGVVLATNPQANTRCSQALIGGGNRTPDCIKWAGCKLAPPGQCEFGGKMVSPQSGDQAAEGDYELCVPASNTECVQENTESVCLSYQGYLEDTFCKQGKQCLVLIKKPDCDTSF